MKPFVDNWNVLSEAFPWILRSAQDKEQRLLECPTGWLPLLWDVLEVLEVIAQVQAKYAQIQVRVAGICERQSELHIKLVHATPDAQDLVDGLRLESAVVCSICGAESEARPLAGGGSKALCSSHQWPGLRRDV